MKNEQPDLVQEDVFAMLAVTAHHEVVRWQLQPILDHVLQDLPTNGVFEARIPRILCRFLVFKEIYADRHPTLASVRRDLAAGPDHIRNLLIESASPQEVCNEDGHYESLGSFLKRLVDKMPSNFARSHIAAEAALEEFAQREAS